MKRILFLLSFFVMFSTLVAHANVKVQVQALNDFNPLNQEELKVKLEENISVGELVLNRNDELYCILTKKTDPKRLKRDMKLYFEIQKYKKHGKIESFVSPIEAKYLDMTFKDRVVKSDKKEATIKTAGTVGTIFLPIITEGVYFIDGARKNEQNSRVKSGFKEMYNNSPFVYVEKGEEINIKKYDIFYLVID